MAKKSSNLPKPNPTKKMVLTKKETKQQKINLKKGKKLQPSQSQLDEDQQEINQDEPLEDSQDESGSQNQEDSEGSDDDEGSEDEESDDDQSSQSLAPENYAVKQMSFRERRGTKMNYLMNRKKEEQEDPFWQNQGQDYFGNVSDEQEDEDYQQSSSGRDQFDSDFGQTQSQHQEQEKKVEEPDVDQDKAKQRKKQQELMRKIGAPAPKKAAPKTNSSNKKVESEKKPAPEVANRYIHQVCTQQELLAEAAQTEYINWLSLQKLISLQNEKKDFTHKQHFLEGEKIVYRDRINEEGKRATTYELCGVQVNKISDLTQFWQKQGQEQ